MYKLFFLTFLNILYQQGTNTVSPDGNFKLTIETREESDQQTRYVTKLTDNVSKETIEIANCIRRDLSAPNSYWDKDSNYLIFEQCDESFKDNRIRILNLKTKKTEFELIGLIGNRDESEEQFDFKNGILFYFDTSTDNKSKVPDLWTFNIATKERKKLFEFGTYSNMELPDLKRNKEKREITLRYSDMSSGQHTKQVEY